MIHGKARSKRKANVSNAADGASNNDGSNAGPPSGQLPFDEASPLMDLPDEHDQGNHGQRVDIVALYPGSRRGTGAGAQEIQDAQTGQAAAGHRQHGQAEQAAHGSHDVHLPGQRHVQRRFTRAGPGRRVDGFDQQQAADGPGNQRPTAVAANTMKPSPTANKPPT